MLAMDLGFMGPNYPIATACATGNYCILRRAGAVVLLRAALPRRCCLRAAAVDGALGVPLYPHARAPPCTPRPPADAARRTTSAAARPT